VDWKKRPLPDHFIRYAVNDVLFLKPLYDLLQNELESLNRTKWFIQESNKFYSSEFYQLDPYKDFKKSQIADKLDLKHKLFLFRLLNWRNQKAKDQNVTKEAILPSKIIPYILKGISIGQSPLEQSRRIPDGLLKKYLQDWLNLFGDPPLDWELEIIKELNPYEVETPEISIKYELFYNAVQLFCLQNKIAIELVLPRSLLKELKINKEKGLEMIQNSWRKDFFGQTFLNIVHRIGEMQIELSQNKITLG
jgi:ribonuclease D